MRIFKHPNISFGWKCPICGTNEDKKVVLIGIYGTLKDKIMEAQQFHIDCIDLLYYPNQRILIQKLD